MIITDLARLQEMMDQAHMLGIIIPEVSVPYLVYHRLVKELGPLAEFVVVKHPTSDNETMLHVPTRLYKVRVAPF